MLEIPWKDWALTRFYSCHLRPVPCCISESESKWWSLECAFRCFAGVGAVVAVVVGVAVDAVGDGRSHCCAAEKRRPKLGALIKSENKKVGK